MASNPSKENVDTTMDKENQQASNSKKRSADTEGTGKTLRRSERAPKKRDMFHKEILVQGGFIETEWDEIRGLDQPGGHKMTPEEKKEKKESMEGLKLTKALLNAGWIWRKREKYGDIIIRPGIPKAKEEYKVNFFSSWKYQDLYQKYRDDGNTLDRILERGSQDAVDKGTNGEENAAVATTSADDDHGTPEGTLVARAPTGTGTSVASHRTLTNHAPAGTPPVAETAPAGAPPVAETAPADGAPVAETANAAAPIVVVKQETGTPQNVITIEDESPKPMGILQRLMRIEKEIGGPDDRGSKNIRERIALNEGEVGITHAEGDKLLQRVDALETALGIEL